MRDKLKYLVYCISTEIVETNSSEYKYPCYYPLLELAGAISMGIQHT